MKWQDENVKASVIKSRHEMIKVVGVSFFIFMFFASMVGGCTYYNIESLKNPVKYDVNHKETYERGGKNE